ncbi:nuclear transport factor 2 family protein [Nonlabens ulvanivorans]|uniref:nuclear transport factor 2 family protein n=1 Tax=Nonlabens ulvanivorans TaxID=906888 RepID=UPI0029435393|nr:nuclear transport factor 2 family protein [Nonlabens ulvanivorans]WOI23656.1 nuclear transport factor 2 family protein [Nonlabens ulvanivorans]
MRSSLLLIGFMILAFAKAFAQQPTVTDSVTTTVSIVEKVKPADAVIKFFEYFHQKDTLAMREMMADKVTINSLIISESNGRRVIDTTVDDFLKGIAQIPDSVSFEERLIQIKTTNSVDIATVSTSYEFYMNKGFTHNGTNVFTLIYIDDKWMVAGITDTRQYP